MKIDDYVVKKYIGKKNDDEESDFQPDEVSKSIENNKL